MKEAEHFRGAGSLLAVFLGSKWCESLGDFMKKMTALCSGRPISWKRNRINLKTSIAAQWGETENNPALPSAQDSRLLLHLSGPN